MQKQTKTKKAMKSTVQRLSPVLK